MGILAWTRCARRVFARGMTRASRPSRPQRGRSSLKKPMGSHSSLRRPQRLPIPGSSDRRNGQKQQEHSLRHDDTPPCNESSLPPLRILIRRGRGRQEQRNRALCRKATLSVHRHPVRFTAAIGVAAAWAFVFAPGKADCRAEVAVEAEVVAAEVAARVWVCCRAGVCSPGGAQA